jgi:hypothetical protein
VHEVIDVHLELSRRLQSPRRVEPSTRLLTACELTAGNVGDAQTAAGLLVLRGHRKVRYMQPVGFRRRRGRCAQPGLRRKL